MQWIIHWVFCNWDLPSLADGAFVFSPLQACATYGKLMPPSLFAICSFWTEKLLSSVKLKGQTPFCSYRCRLDFLQRRLSHQPVHIHSRKSTTQETHFALLIGWEATETHCNCKWDFSVRQRWDFTNVKARIWQNHWSERDFLLPLLSKWLEEDVAIIQHFKDPWRQRGSLLLHREGPSRVRLGMPKVPVEKPH